MKFLENRKHETRVKTKVEEIDEIYEHYLYSILTNSNIKMVIKI